VLKSVEKGRAGRGRAPAAERARFGYRRLQTRPCSTAVNPSVIRQRTTSVPLEPNREFPRDFGKIVRGQMRAARQQWGNGQETLNHREESLRSLRSLAVRQGFEPWVQV
jgi:hypothetical protein